MEEDRHKVDLLGMIIGCIHRSQAWYKFCLGGVGTPCLNGSWGDAICFLQLMQMPSSPAASGLLLLLLLLLAMRCLHLCHCCRLSE